MRPLRSISIPESYLIRVNYALKFIDKNEINKMFISVNTAAKKRTFLSFTFGRSGISCRKSIFVWWLRCSCFKCVHPAWFAGMKCFVSFRKVSKMPAGDSSYERNNQERFKITLKLIRIGSLSEWNPNTLEIKDCWFLEIPKQQDCAYFRLIT